MKVKYLPFQPHCFAFGGFEIQMLSTLDAVEKAGVAAEKMDPWSRDAEFDILHLWGLELAHFSTIKFAKKAGKKVIITALFSYFETLEEKGRNLASSFIGAAKFHREMAPFIDGLVVVNELQKEVAIRYYGFSANKISIIPNVVGENFFLASLAPHEPARAPYILSSGNICPRKNQLNLVKACLKANVSLILVGGVLQGEEAYAREIESLIASNNNISWKKEIKANSPELVDLYVKSAGFALCSYAEQQPISALEAAICRKPLLLGKRDYGRQSFYTNAYLAEPNAVPEIVAGLKAILGKPELYKVPQHLLDECREPRIGSSYQEFYKQVLKI